MAGSTPRRIDTPETERLFLRPFVPEDESSFLRGTADGELRRMYGFPEELPEQRARQIFRRFAAFPAAYALERKADGAVVGFLLDVPPELPEEELRDLPLSGRTLAFATFRPYRQQGYMREALVTLIDRYRRTKAAAYLHGGHFPFNEPSRSLLRSLGFTERGRHTSGTKLIVDEILFIGE